MNKTMGDKGNNETLRTTLKIACTPGAKISDPIKCFRSHLKEKKARGKRSPLDGPLPETQYQYSFSGADVLNQNQKNQNRPQNSKWSSPNEANPNSYYYQGPAQSYYQGYGREAVTPAYVSRRADSSLPAAAEVPPTTPAPAAGTSKLPELRQVLKAAKPFVGSCIGATTGCAMCVLVLGRLPLGAVPAACTGPCFVGTFGSCGSLLGRVFSETTVICTELFRQGMIDTETFVADAEFGRMMVSQFPTAFQGYQFLATPVVELMKKSSLITNLVSTFAIPWSHHMKFLMGRSNDPSVPGLLIHTLGFPLCNIAGQLKATFSSISITSLILTLALLLLITLFTNLQGRSRTKVTTKGSKEDKESRNFNSSSNSVALMLGRSQEVFQHLFGV